MTNSLATLALVCLFAGSVAAQQPAKSTSGKKSTGKAGTISATDAARSSSSAANTHDGTNGASTGTTGGGGTGLTNDQSQAAANPTSNGPTKVDASSSVRTGASSVKGKKKYPKSNS